ncbi:hypothetical protein, partial [Burkholderia pseudomallei]
SVNRLFFMTSFSPLEAILSSFNWSENSRAGHFSQNGAVPNCVRLSQMSRTDRPATPARREATRTALRKRDACHTGRFAAESADCRKRLVVWRSVVIGFRLTRRDRIRRAIAWCDRPARRSFHYRKPAQSRRRRRLARLARLGAILEDSMDAIFILFASRPQQRRCSVGQNGSPVLFAGCVNQREPSTVM